MSWKGVCDRGIESFVDVYFVIPTDVVMFTYFLNRGVGLTLLYMEKDLAIRRSSR